MRRLEAGLCEVYGVRLSRKQRKALWVASLLERITRHRAFSGFTASQRSQLFQMTQRLWLSLFLAISDDDFDCGAVDTEQFLERMARIYATIEANFHAATRQIRFAPVFAAVKTADADFGRSFLSMVEVGAQANLSSCPSSAPCCPPLKEYNKEEAVNLYGAACFGFELGRLVLRWVDYGVPHDCVEKYVSNCATNLILGVRGQVLSAGLRGPEPVTLAECIQICRLKSGSAVRICTELRMVLQLPEIEAFYSRFDPLTLQFVLDDLMDFSEDSAQGNRNILHIMIEEQGSLAHAYGRADWSDCTGHILIDATTRDFLCFGTWSSMAARDESSAPRLVAVDRRACRQMLENSWVDAFLSFRWLITKRISMASDLREALGQADPGGCERVALRSGILSKFRKLVH